MKFLDALRINPRFAEGVRRFGFRKWYERELIFSHAYLALALLALAGMLGAIEVFAGATLLLKLLDFAFIAICGATVFVAAKGYLKSLADAEWVASQAVCSACETYGRFSIELESRRTGEVRVCCKHCSNRWLIQTNAEP